MTRIPRLASFYAAALHVLVADALVARDSKSLDKSGLIYSTTEVITQFTTVTDHTTSVETDIVTLTQTAYVITTPIEKTVTETVTNAEESSNYQAEQTDVYATAVPTEAFPSGVVFEDAFPTAEATFTVDYSAQQIETEFIALPTQTLPAAVPLASEPVIYQEESTPAFPTPEVPHTTLQPAVYFNLELDNLANLIPTDNHDLYYTPDGIADPTVEHSYALLNASLAAVAVTLEHSIYIASVTCQGSDLIITFTTQDAYDIAEITWPIPESFILITHTYGCTPIPESNPTRTYFSVSVPTFSGLSVTLKATEIALEDALNEADLSWGTYTPNDNNTLPVLAASFETPLPTPLGTPYSSTFAAPSSTLAVFEKQQSVTTSCGPLPAATISGLPAAPCGSDFDRTIDEALGFVSFSENSLSQTLEDIAPGLGDYNIQDYEDDVEGPVSRNLEKRDFFSFSPSKAFEKFAQDAITAVQSVPANVKNTVNQGVANAQQGFNAVAEAVTNIFDPSVDAPFTVDLGPKKLVDSPFGDAYQIFFKGKDSKNGQASGEIGLYCVKCGVKGTARVQGKMSFSVVQTKITSGNLKITGNIDAGIGLGLAAQATYANTFTENIVSFGVPGFSIPKVVTIGPVLALDVDLAINIKAAGTVLVGADAVIPNFVANLDLVDAAKSSQSGFEPQFKTYFNVSGEITASANLGVPMTIGVGIDLVPLKTRKLISIKNRPGIEATAQYAYSNTDPGDCNNGISYGIALTNDASLDFFGLSTKNLVNYRKDVLTKCYSFGKKKDTVKRQLRFERQAATPTAIPTATPLQAVEDNEPSSSTFVDLESLAIQNEDLISESQKNSNGLNYTTVTDSTGAYNLAAGKDGNFHVQNTNIQTFDGNTVFATVENIITSDGSERFILYYPDAMKEFGVSRFRVADTDHFPETADIVSLIPLNADNNAMTPGIFVAVGTSGIYLYPVICNIANQASKIFLVNDVQKGLQTLMDPALRFIVTGGVVTDCEFIAFMSGSKGF